MRSLVVVATTSRGSINKFAKASITEAKNLKDFLEQTEEYASVTLYELEKSFGPLMQWSELEETAE